MRRQPRWATRVIRPSLQSSLRMLEIIILVPFPRKWNVRDRMKEFSRALQQVLRNTKNRWGRLMRGTRVCRAQMGTPATFRAASSRPGNPTLRRVRTTSHSLQTNISSSIWGKYSWRNWDSSSRAIRIRRRWVIREPSQTLINDMAPFKRMVLEEAKWESGLSRTCSSTRRSRRSPRCSARVPIRLLTLKVCNNIFIKTRLCTTM